MADKCWNVAIFGPGAVAGAYVHAFHRRDDIRVTHVIGRELERAAAFARAHQIECEVYADLESALNDSAVDIVGVFTPHNLHAEATIAAAKAGKHIIIEKPVCVSLGELRAMRSAVRTAGVKTIVGFVLRWNPLLTLISSHVEGGSLGEIIFAEADYLHCLLGKAEVKPWYLRRDVAGTSLLIGGCHAVDAIRFLVGQRVTQVSAVSTTRNDVTDYAGTEIALLRFDGGAVGKVASCLEGNLPYNFNVEVFGTRGTFRNNRYYGDLLPGQTDFATVPTILPDSGDVSHHPFDGEVAHFIDCLNRNRRPMPDLEDAAETMEVCFAAEISAREGRVVELPLENA